MLHRSVTGLVTAALIALPFAALAAAPQALSIDPSTGSSATYHLSFDGHLWNGQHKVYEHDIALTRTSDRLVHAVVSKQESGERADFSAARAADGQLTPDNHDEQFSAYNTVADLANSAPRTPSAGQAWDTSVVVDLGSGVNVNVPVHAWVAGVDGTRTTVQGTGKLATSVTYSGFTVPIELSIRVASLFDNGAFARADSSATEVIHAGPQEQTLDWTWSLRRNSAQ